MRNNFLATRRSWACEHMKLFQHLVPRVKWQPQEPINFHEYSCKTIKSLCSLCQTLCKACRTTVPRAWKCRVALWVASRAGRCRQADPSAPRPAYPDHPSVRWMQRTGTWHHLLACILIYTWHVPLPLTQKNRMGQQTSLSYLLYIIYF